MTLITSSHIDTGNLTAAIEACIVALGSDAVITDAKELLEYRDPFNYRESDEYDAAAVVLPTTTEQIQAIVRIANEYHVRLWTFGQGHNIAYGATAPRLKGSILVNLRKMNRVLEINSELAYVVVEPGVSYDDLYAALAAEGSGLWNSLADLSFGSVVGNTLEYGVGYSPYGDHAHAAGCGLEVVLPDGSVLRTGMGAQTDNSTWHVYPHSYGPSVAGLFHQSNLGIVTQMGYWVHRRPEVYTCCRITLEGYEALGTAIDTLRELMLDRTIENHPMFIGGVTLDENGMPQMFKPGEGWFGHFALYGRESLVEAQFAAAEAALSSIPSLRLTRRTFSGDDVTSMETHYERCQRGIPDMTMLDPSRLPFGEYTAHLDFSPVVPTTGKAVVEMTKIVRSVYAGQGRVGRTGVHMRPRSSLLISTSSFDSRDKEQTKAAYDGYAELISAVSSLGNAASYRTNLPYMDMVADQFSFGDHAQLRFVQTIKDALDPNGVLSPGKSGIWSAIDRNGR